MVRIVGVRFKSVGKIYYFDPQEFDIHVGDRVVVETTRGMELGRVAIGIREVNEDSVVLPLKAVSRMATEADIQMDAQNRIHEKEAYAICNEKIKKHELDMKLVEVEYTFDGSKILFYFTADGRVDFRELVKDLASIFKTRIELRQIGVRDETKYLGGIGMCGRVLCCHSFLPEFAPVSIKMAKEQNLPLNPTKISGVCGRLMCCLKNEQETYEWLNSRCPNVGDVVYTNDGLKGEVSNVNVLRQQVKVIISTGKDEKEIKEYPVESLKFTRGKKYRDEKPDDSEVAQLEELERKDNQNKDSGENRNARGTRENRSGKDFQKRGENRPNRDRQERPERRERRETQEQRSDHQQNRDHKNHEDRRGRDREHTSRRGQDRRGNRGEGGAQNRPADSKKDEV
jgi:cell fate regulator YaaT (PSP1 superfamily)